MVNELDGLVSMNAGSANDCEKLETPKPKNGKHTFK